jgi:hypothetical protein
VGVFTMNKINAEAVADLVQTYDHWVFNDPAVATVLRQRVAA